MSNYELHCGDCLEVMPTLPDASIDAIIADIPYGTTACAWDTVIPFDAMWAQLKRLIKPRGAIVLFGSQPFTSALVMSNADWFKYEWVWDKKLAGNGLLAKVQPLKVHENILIFNSGIYNPRMKVGKTRRKMGVSDKRGTFSFASTGATINNVYYPQSIIVKSVAGERISNVHPTQKPVALMEYLIRTYTNEGEGEAVLDFTMGSGTTGVACMTTGRKFIGIEQDRGYFEIAQDRIADAARIARKEFKPMNGGVDIDKLPLFAMA